MPPVTLSLAQRIVWGEAAFSTLFQEGTPADHNADLRGRRIDIRLFDRCAIEAEVRRQLGRWQELLATRAVSDGRQLLRERLLDRSG
jgi:hypothetical protein